MNAANGGGGSLSDFKPSQLSLGMRAAPPQATQLTAGRIVHGSKLAEVHPADAICTAPPATARSGTRGPPAMIPLGADLGCSVPRDWALRAIQGAQFSRSHPIQASADTTTALSPEQMDPPGNHSFLRETLARSTSISQVWPPQAIPASRQDRVVTAGSDRPLATPAERAAGTNELNRSPTQFAGHLWVRSQLHLAFKLHGPMIDCTCWP